MTIDTGIGGTARAFPRTRLSAVIAARSGDAAERSRAWNTLIGAYWKPAYMHVRFRWKKSSEDAKDLVQGFFQRALEKGFFDQFDPARARFRTFLRTCLDGYVANEAKAEGRLKRGGGETVVSLDLEGTHALPEPPVPDLVEQCFDDAWVRGIFEAAVDALRSECSANGRDVHFQLFQRHDLDPPPGARSSYAALATDYGISVSDVTNWLSLARREFRRLVLDQLREITANDEEFREEARVVLGLDCE